MARRDRSRLVYTRLDIYLAKVREPTNRSSQLTKVHDAWDDSYSILASLYYWAQI